jgi:hypothetical protein
LLSEHAPGLHTYGIERLIQQVWAIPGRVNLLDQNVQRVRIRGNIPGLAISVKAFAPCLPTVTSGPLGGQVKPRGFWAKSWRLSRCSRY